VIPPDEGDLAGILGYLGKIRPADMASRFARAGGFDASSFSPCDTGFEGSVAAVDGSNAMVLETGSFSVALVRAVETTFLAGRRSHAGETSLRAFRIGPEEKNPVYDLLYGECFEDTPREPLDNEDRSRAAAAFRDTLEYWTALRLAETLDRGDVLLLDGALRVDHESHRPVLKKILDTALSRGVLVAAVTKMASSTWGGGIPLVPAAEALARDLGVAGAWYLAVPLSVMDTEKYRQWDFSATYVASLHPRSPRAFKIDLPAGSAPSAVRATFAALASYADDGRVTGYPFPLFDAHRFAAIGKDQVDQVRQTLIRRMSETGMTSADFRAYFGDYHDTFAPYR
jgi:hypothetical protein